MRTIPKPELQAAAKKLSESLADSGQIIEGGWAGFCLAVMPKGASQTQIDEMRKAFFAGALHLFASIMCVLEPDAEPTEKDMRRMSQIHEELQTFQRQLEASIGH